MVSTWKLQWELRGRLWGLGCLCGKVWLMSTTHRHCQDPNRSLKKTPNPYPSFCALAPVVPASSWACMERGTCPPAGWLEVSDPGSPLPFHRGRSEGQKDWKEAPGSQPRKLFVGLGIWGLGRTPRERQSPEFPRTFHSKGASPPSPLCPGPSPKSGGMLQGVCPCSSPS